MKEFIKKHKISFFVIISAIIMLVGFSYAWLQLNLRGDKELTITAGTLELVLNDSMDGSISIVDTVPIKDEQGLQSKGYTFTLSNTGNIDSSYEIYLDDLELSESDIRMDDSFIRYELTKNGERLSYDLLSTTKGGKSDRLLDAGEIEFGKMYTYTLKMWIDSNATNAVMGTVFKGKIRINAIQSQQKTFIKTLLSKASSKGNTDNATELQKKEMFTVHHQAGAQQENFTTEELTDYRYMGSSPNNYIRFNDELWRIIGIFTVESEDGIKRKRVKIIRNESIGDFKWDNKAEGVGSSISWRGSNNWSDSALQIELNSGSFYSELSSIAKNMIETTKWYLGGASTSAITANNFYIYERGTSVGSGRSTYWIGKIGMMYPSDYGYAAGSSNCLSFKVSEYNYSCFTNWLYSNSQNQKEWTITPRNIYSNDNIFAIVDNRNISYYETDYSFKVRPCIYLKSSLLYDGGDGSYENPYQIIAD